MTSETSTPSPAPEPVPVASPAPEPVPAPDSMPAAVAVPPASSFPTMSPASYAPAIPDAVAPAPAQPRRRRRGAVAAVVLLSLLLAAALGVGGYLWYAADRWSADAAVWETQAREHGQHVAALENELEAVTRELTAARDQLTTVREQLSTATARITELANEKAQLGDANAVNQALIDYQQRVSEAAGTVAQALGRCTDGQGRLIEYLRTPEQWDPDSLQQFADQVSALCAQATEANERLQTELQR